MALTDEEFEAVIVQLQQQSFADAIKAYGKTGFLRWRNPQFNRPLDKVNGFGRLTGSCGDTIEISLCIDRERVKEAAYRTDGCASSQLCGSFAAELAHGLMAEELFSLAPEDILSKMEAFPEEDVHCARLAINTLHEAVSDYLVQRHRHSKS